MKTDEIVTKFFNLKRTMGDLLRLVETDRDLGLTEMYILLKIQDEKSITLTKLSEITGYSNSLITFAIDDLEGRGLVKRVKGRDRRAFYVELTEDGRIKCNELKKLMNERIMQIFSSLEESEIIELVESMEKILGILKKLESKAKDELKGKET
ncbi:MAG: MarR family winged helix-turn-helix transcriptional regulator [Thermoplasmata archaeon]|jgi:DNA-binding MarR family transcriptional regulator|nr:MAG: hypothetical protein C0180_04840 [Aciduliprofundum sp.]HEU12885.1 MarR family transcriptional regulator [Euryarchaeota archaeon]